MPNYAYGIIIDKQAREKWGATILQPIRAPPLCGQPIVVQKTNIYEEKNKHQTCVRTHRQIKTGNWGCG